MTDTAQHDSSCWQTPATTSHCCHKDGPGLAGLCSEVGPPQVVAILGPTPVFHCPMSQLTKAVTTAAVGIHMQEAWVWHLGFG